MDPDGSGSQWIGAGVAAGASNGAAVVFRQRFIPTDGLRGGLQIFLERAVKGAHAREELFTWLRRVGQTEFVGVFADLCCQLVDLRFAGQGYLSATEATIRT